MSLINRLFSISLLLIGLVSCFGKHNSDAQRAKITNEIATSGNHLADTLTVALDKSIIWWKGTKMRGAGKHEGKLQLNSAFLLVKNGSLVGGEFIADMNSIGVTDIPESDPIPIRNLNNHLKSSDFFDVIRYPTSKFEITHVSDLQNDSILVSGIFRIKDVTRNVAFKAAHRGKEFSTDFIIDRLQWNIAYEGSWADKTLVDRDFELKVKLIAD